MTRTFSDSQNAASAMELIERLQRRFADRLEAVAHKNGDDTAFSSIEWLRDDGKHGGGARLGVVETTVFNRATINVSHVHYDDIADKRLRSANALSTIIHPQHPQAPSVHMHFSYTELRDGSGSWRLMADLNPSHAIDDDTERFKHALASVAGDAFDHAVKQGDKYFAIPSQQRTRGVFHFYLEGHKGDSFDDEKAYVEKVATTAIDTYTDLLGDRLVKASPTVSDDENAHQLRYHTLYGFQVLTLDRGTTSGLLVHDQNDVGTLGSIPTYVDKPYMASLKENVPDAQRPLVDGIVNALDDAHPSPVTDAVRAELAQVLRRHYQAHPDALQLQASGFVVPPTVQNHKA